IGGAGVFEFCELLAQLLGDRRVDVGDQGLGGGGGGGLGFGDRLVDALGDLVLEPLLAVGVPELPGFEVAAEAVDRVALLPGLDLLLVAVARGVVGGGMAEAAVGDRLDEGRSLAAAGAV